MSSSSVATYVRAVEAFNQSDMQSFGELFADDCEFVSTGGSVGTSRAEIVANLTNARTNWVSHNPVGTVAAGEFLVVAYENHYADGSIVTAAGCLRFNSDGKVIEVRTLEPR